jgi:lipoate-protein ligase A
MTDGKEKFETLENVRWTQFSDTVQKDLVKLFNGDTDAIAEYFNNIKSAGRTVFLEDLSNRMQSLEEFESSDKQLEFLTEKYGETFLKEYEKDMSDLMDAPKTAFNKAFSDFSKKYKNTEVLTDDEKKAI